MGRRRNPWLLHAGRGATYFLKASLTFSPASLRLDFAWSPLPMFSALVAGDLADRFLGLTAKV
jgi:hypothetical protein